MTNTDSDLNSSTDLAQSAAPVDGPHGPEAVETAAPKEAAPKAKKKGPTVAKVIENPGAYTFEYLTWWHGRCPKGEDKAKLEQIIRARVLTEAGYPAP